MFLESLHHRKREKHIRQSFRITQARGRFRIVFRELQRIRKQESVQPRSGARSAVARIDPRQAFFLRAQRRLRQQTRISKRLLHHAFTQRRDGFRHHANALLVFSRKKKWAQERTMDAFAESEPLGAHACV